MGTLADNNITRQSELFQSTERKCRRKSPPIFAEISISSHVGYYIYVVVIRRSGKRIDQLFGKLFHNDSKSSERAWLFASGMAFEWRDRHSLGSRLLFRESAYSERRSRIT